MLPQLAWRVVKGSDPLVLWRLGVNLGLRGGLAMLRHRLRLRRGVCFPPVLFISVTTRCNLRCQGCWVAVDGPAVDMPQEQLEGIIRSARRRGNHFFGLLGGEPLAYRPLLDVIARHKDCYFQLFTNGTMLTREVARDLRRLGNVTPLVSVEGLEAVSDERRGGRGVYASAMAALENCRREGLFFGVASSICRSNFEELVSESFVREAMARGAMYLWFYIYRPSGPAPHPELALSAEQIRDVRRFLVEARRRWPILLVDAYWDQLGRAMCPAARGISHHVNPWGQVELCPPVQFAADRLDGQPSPAAVVASSRFLADFRHFASLCDGGCVLLEKPRELEQFVRRWNAADSSGRGTALAELAAMSPRPSHRMDGQEIPETHWMYRLAKKHAFFGLGAYG